MPPSSPFFRPFYKAHDIERIAALVKECDVADDLDAFVANDSLCRGMIKNEENAVLVEVDGRVVAAGLLTSVGPGSYLIEGCVHPEFRRRGLGRLLLRTCERRARELARAQGEHSVLHAMAWQNNHSHRLLLFTEDFTKVRTFKRMVRSLGELPTPSPTKLVIRPPVQDEFERVVLAVDGAFAESSEVEMVPAGSGRETPSAVDFRKFNPMLCVAAFDGQNVAGALVGIVAPDPTDASGAHRRVRIDRLGVRPHWRRRGIARELLCRALHLFQFRGFETVELSVDADSAHGAQELYASTAFDTVNASTFYVKQMAAPTRVA